MAYSLVVSLLMGLAAFLLEKGVRFARIPARAIWFISIGLSVGLSLFALFNPIMETRPVAQATAAWVKRAEPSMVPPSLATLDAWSPWLLGMSLTMSAVFVLLAAWTFLRLGRETDALPEEEVNGITIKRSATFGPALVGVRKARVVIPHWLASVDPEAENMAIEHEFSHLTARDSVLQFAALVLAIAMPWNPIIWWQFARLRDAVEVDCDVRILDTGTDVATYASILVEIAANRINSPFPAVAFFSTNSQLARRVTTMVQHKGPPRYLRTTLLAAFGLALAFTACETPQPVGVEPISDSEVAAELADIEAVEFRATPIDLSLGLPLGTFRFFQQAGVPQGQAAYEEVPTRALEALREVEQAVRVRAIESRGNATFELRETTESAVPSRVQSGARFDPRNFVGGVVTRASQERAEELARRIAAESVVERPVLRQVNPVVANFRSVDP